MATTATDPKPASPPLSIRLIACEDADAVCQLTGQLGYEASLADIQQRIARLASCTDVQAAFVACLGAEIVGWIEVAITRHLQTPPFALIGGLVVKDGVRGLGIGRKLCQQVEAWARLQDIALLRVTSRSTRNEAHRFYLRDGYTEVKTSKVFEKILP
jgi:GNAT superfamily N-acetyltransferase